MVSLCITVCFFVFHLFVSVFDATTADDIAAFAANLALQQTSVAGSANGNSVTINTVIQQKQFQCALNTVTASGTVTFRLL